ncbi:MAG TPA: heme-binding protein [Candidatus Binataceae bacterium]|nr:heme-binding protein [Candidatus Binataceae bacterium]
MKCASELVGSLGGRVIAAAVALAMLSLAGAERAAMAGHGHDGGALTGCDVLKTASANLKTALQTAQAGTNGGLSNQMWGTLVARDGTVCAVAFSGADAGSQWLLSRVVSAQKANTANGLSVASFALSTANLFSAVNPGGSLYGLQHSNPVDTQVAYQGNAKFFGTSHDPMIGNRIGGVNVFGGGLALYDKTKGFIGAVGVRGDTSCADHNVAWRTRANLGLDFLKTDGVGGVNGTADPDRPDNIIYDITNVSGFQIGSSKSGFGHAACIPDNGSQTDSTTLPPVQ